MGPHCTVREGTPPGMPGFQSVSLSPGMRVKVSTKTVAVLLLEASAAEVATTWYVPGVAGAV